MPVKVTDTKRYRGAVADFFGQRPAAVKVGVFGAKGDEAHTPHKLADGSANDTTPATLAEIAMFHEFGLGVPERSFVRSYFDAHRDELAAYAVELMTAELDKALIAGVPVSDAQRAKVLRIIGLRMVRDMQAGISNRDIKQELSDETVARKGSDTALIDTGQLRAGITSVVSLDGKF